MRFQPIALDEWQCACGARTEEREALCAKCRARARWERRTARVRRAVRRAIEQTARHGPCVPLAVVSLFGVSGP